MVWKKGLAAGGKFLAGAIAPDAINTAGEIAKDIYENQQNMIKIPDLKDVHIDEAMRILKDELNLLPTSVICKPSVAYADERENEVMSSEPKFGTRVAPGSLVKLYYLTSKVIEESKEQSKMVPQIFPTPRIIGINVYEARTELEELGLNVILKLEKPHKKLFDLDDGQVTKITYPDGKKVGKKLKIAERVVINYVDDEVIADSLALKNELENKKGKLLNNITKKVTKPFKKNNKTR